MRISDWSSDVCSSDLWERIKHKTTYRVHFDNAKLIDDCVTAIAGARPIAKARVTIRKADLAIGQGGVLATETSTSGPVTLEEGDIVLPNVLTDLRSEEHTSDLQSLMRLSYAVFCLTKT